MRRPENILAVVLAASLAAYPLLRGGWDLWSQLAAQSFLCAGATAWLALCLAQGRLPRLPFASWLAAMAVALGFLSLQLSPVKSLAWPEYRWWAAAVALAFLVPFVPEVWRERCEKILLALGAAMAPLALYQRFVLPGTDMTKVTGPFFNENMFAGYFLMLLPLALARRYWGVSGVLLCGLAAVNSRGAWLVLGALGAFWAVSAARRRMAWFFLLLLAGTASFVFLARFNIPSVTERLSWWCGALAMIAERPLSGFGPGSFGFVYPAFHDKGVLSTLYAHNCLLQFAAEFGLPCALAWLCWAALRLRRLPSGPRWAVLAVALHSLIDFTLYAPAIFFVFCWLLSLGEDGEYSRLQGRRARAASSVAAIAAGAWLLFVLPGPWLLQKKLLAAKHAYSAGAASVPELRRLAAENPEDANASLLCASALSASAYESKDKELLSLSAVEYERALRLNPFRQATYSELAGVYIALGKPQEARRVSASKERRFRI